MLPNPVLVRPCAMWTTPGARLRPTNAAAKTAVAVLVPPRPSAANTAMSKGARATSVCQPYQFAGPRTSGEIAGGGVHTATGAGAGTGTGTGEGSSGASGEGGAGTGATGGASCAAAGTAATEV